MKIDGCDPWRQEEEEEEGKIKGKGEVIPVL
jgi:hypothetical protein